MAQVLHQPRIEATHIISSLAQQEQALVGRLWHCSCSRTLSVYTPTFIRLCLNAPAPVHLSHVTTSQRTKTVRAFARDLQLPLFEAHS